MCRRDKGNASSLESCQKLGVEVKEQNLDIDKKYTGKRALQKMPRVEDIQVKNYYGENVLDRLTVHR